MLWHAEQVSDARAALAADAPPMWMCDHDRVEGSPVPGDFDNRYLIDDSILPGPLTLRSAGITRIVYIGRASEPDELDLGDWLYLLQQNGFQIQRIHIDKPASWNNPHDYTVVKRVRAKPDLRRSPAGGFGGGSSARYGEQRWRLQRRWWLQRLLFVLGRRVWRVGGSFGRRIGGSFGRRIGGSVVAGSGALWSPERGLRCRRIGGSVVAGSGARLSPDRGLGCRRLGLQAAEVGDEGLAEIFFELHRGGSRAAGARALL